MVIAVAAETRLQDDVRRLLGELNATLLALTPPEFCFRMTAEQMAQPDTTVLLARENGAAAACGALRCHAERTAEVKRCGPLLDYPDSEYSVFYAKALDG
jgi:putative acetyltransferase